MNKIVATKFVKGQLPKELLDNLYLLTRLAQEKMDKRKYKIGKYSFSRVVSIDNILSLKSRIVEITKENEKYLRSEYVKRRKGEISYLKRFFPEDCPVDGKIGKKIDVILYSAKQLKKEGDNINGDWGIVAINVEERKTTPILPQTIINNQLGIKFGGNGERINIKEYEKSVRFWNKHAIKKY
jgi:hypothetical protein